MDIRGTFEKRAPVDGLHKMIHDTMCQLFQTIS